VNPTRHRNGLFGRTQTPSRIARLLTLLVALTLVAAACGGDDDDTSDAASDSTPAGEGGEGDGGAIEGEVNVSGSSTVEPISIRVAELFEDVESGVTVNVDGPGTGDGFQLFCQGEIDISDASRAIKEEEAAACEEAGIEFVEIKVAFDGISVLTSPDNEVECLSFADLYSLVGPESQGFDNWSDAAPLARELGSETAFPDAPLDITAPGEESGTYDSFLELALAGAAEERVGSGDLSEDEAESTRPDYSSQSDDNAIITGIEGSESSFGWVGFAFAEEAGDQVKEIAISEEPGGECVTPSSDTIADGSYPLSRPLFIYVSTAAAEENPAVAAYVDFYLGEGIEAVEEVGYVALPDDQLGESADAWSARTTGTREG
jgi:phosphate transport system substrate-binding protein